MVVGCQHECGGEMQSQWWVKLGWLFELRPKLYQLRAVVSSSLSPLFKNSLNDHLSFPGSRWLQIGEQLFNLIFFGDHLFHLLATSGWHISDAAQWPGLGSSLNSTFVVNCFAFFFFFFSPWIIVQPVWFSNLVGCVASQMSASRLCWGWKCKTVELSSWRQEGVSLLRIAAECWTTAWRYVYEAGAVLMAILS